MNTYKCKLRGYYIVISIPILKVLRRLISFVRNSIIVCAVPDLILGTLLLTVKKKMIILREGVMHTVVGKKKYNYKK